MLLGILAFILTSLLFYSVVEELENGLQELTLILEPLSRLKLLGK